MQTLMPTTLKINLLSRTLQRKLGLVDVAQAVKGLLSRVIGEVPMAWTRMVGSSTEVGGTQT